jgi:hypothetical protein
MMTKHKWLQFIHVFIIYQPGQTEATGYNETLA